MITKTINIFLFGIILFNVNSSIYGGQLTYDNIHIIESTSTYLTARIKLDSLRINQTTINDNSYHLIAIEGFHFTSESGKPRLPTKGLLFAVPATGKVQLTVTDSQSEIQSNINVIPVPEQLLTKNNQHEPQFIVDKEFYSRELWFPDNIVQMTDPCFIRDQRAVQVQINPVQYNPAQKKIRHYRSITIRLDFESNAQLGTVSFSPHIEKSLENILANYESGKKWRQSKSKTSAVKKQMAWYVDGPWYKIYVKEDGIYRIGRNELANAGIAVAAIDPQTIKIFNRGRELPIYVLGEKDRQFNDSDYIEFYGQFNRGEHSYLSPYSISNVYWLTWGGNKGLRMAEVDGGLYEKDSTRFICPTHYKFTQHFEEDLNFDRLLLVSDESTDHWFWQTMNANHSYDFKFVLHQPRAADSAATARIMLQGSTHPAAYPDHHVIIKINNYSIEDDTWDGQTEHFIENLNVPNSILKDGENILSVELPGDTPAGEVDQAFFNWFEIDYWRPFRAVDDFSEFQIMPHQGVSQFKVDGFTREDINIIDNHGRRLVNFEVVKNGDTYTAVFQDASIIAPTTYYLFTSNAIKKPEKIIKDNPAELKSPPNGVDYIIITHEQFHDAVLPLADYRGSQGLRVKTVDIQDIYDEFNYGIFDPRAIQQFLKYAYENWTPPAPVYVLLVGDATWTYDKQVARNWGKTCFIPAMMKYTISWGLTSSDNALVCVSGDDHLPDMFIGRLPVNSTQETETVVNKIITYEQHPTLGDWRKRISLVCGDGTFFEQSADYLYNEYIPESFDVPRLYTNPRSPYFGSTEELVNIFNNGTALLNFIGHGGGGVFFDAELFLLEDMVLLNNAAKLPIIFSLTCFTGYFDNPWTPSLGEELLRVSGKGGIATFGAAGRAWLYGDYLLNNALFESLFTNKRRNLGQITTEAKWLMTAWSSSYRDHVENYTLLGDPALKIGFPEKEIALQISNPSLKRGDSLAVQGTIPDNLSGTVKLRVVSSSDSMVAGSTYSVINGIFRAQLPISKNISAGRGLIKAYFWNDKIDGIGSAPFNIETPCFTQIFTEPSQPAHLDSTYIITEITKSPQIASEGIDSVFCLWTSNQYSWNKIFMIKVTDNYYKTQNPIVLSEGTKVTYKISVTFKAENNQNLITIESKQYSYTVKTRADLMITSPGLTITGKDQVFIQAKLKNSGESDAIGFNVEIFDGDSTSGGKQINKINLNILKAKQDTMLNFPWSGYPKGFHILNIRIDSENQIDEVNEYNNLFSRTFKLLTIRDGSGGFVVSEDSNFSVNIPAEAVTFNTSFDIKIKSLEEINKDYPVPENFIPAKLANGFKQFYLLNLADRDIAISKPLSIKFYYQKKDSLSYQNNCLKIYSWNEKNRQWIYNISHFDSSQNRDYVQGIGNGLLFGLFVVNDAVPPKISIKVQDQVFTDGDYVSSQPTISVVLEDESGIDLTNHSLSVALDDQAVDTLNLTYSRSPSSNNMVLLTYRPCLSPGEHELKINAYDVAGNVAKASLNFMVNSGFTVETIANHPNPFVDDTIIAYTLTEEAEAVKIRIYTTSGRLIRTFDFANEMGYVEHLWDGQDEYGDEVANGVYYMRFEAKRGANRIERIEKIARLK